MSDAIYGPAGTRIGIPPLVKPEPTMAGMSLRDWFAGQFVGHLLADAWYQSEDMRDQTMKQVARGLAQDAYDLADAMLAARDAKGGGK